MGKPAVHPTMVAVVADALKAYFGEDNIFVNTNEQTINIKSVSTRAVHKISIERV